MYGSWDIKHDRQNFLSFWVIFYLFSPPLSSLTTQRIKILKKWKEYLEISSFFISVPINDNHMMHGSWDIKCNRQIFFVNLGHFLLFYLLNSPKNENFKKIKKSPGDIINLHNCTKNHDHRYTVPPEMWRVTDATVVFHFGLFLVLLPPNSPKNQNFKIIKKKRLEISPFYTRVPKIMIRCCRVPEIRWATDGRKK